MPWGLSSGILVLPGAQVTYVHGNTKGKREAGRSWVSVRRDCACAERNLVPISLSYRRDQPEPQLTHIPSCISREI